MSEAHGDVALLILASGDPAAEYAEAALERVRESGLSLRVLYVVDRAGCERLAEHLADSARLGAASGRDVASALERTHDEEARTVRDAVAATAGEAGRSVEVEVVSGDFVEEGIRAADRLDARLLLVPPRRRGFWDRFALGGRRHEIKHLAARTGRPVEALPEPYGC